MQRNTLMPSNILPQAAQQMLSFHAKVTEEVQAAIRQHPVVVVGMAHNPFVGKVRRALDAAEISYHYLGYGSYWAKWKQRLAIKLWSGWPTFPQVFVKGMLVGGCQDTIAMLKSGELKKLLQK